MATTQQTSGTNNSTLNFNPASQQLYINLLGKAEVRFRATWIARSVMPFIIKVPR